METDTIKIIDIIEKEYKKIVEKTNTVNGLDFLCEIVDYLKEKYRID